MDIFNRIFMVRVCAIARPSFLDQQKVKFSVEKSINGCRARKWKTHEGKIIHAALWLSFKFLIEYLQQRSSQLMDFSFFFFFFRSIYTLRQTPLMALILLLCK